MATKKKASRQYVNYRVTPAALTPAQFDGLNDLSARTRVPKQVLLREAVDLLLVKHRRRRT
jgi:hypothetical protein